MPRSERREFAVDYADDSITLSDLRTHWEWDPLRNHPQFQKILAGPEPKTIHQLGAGLTGPRISNCLYAPAGSCANSLSSAGAQIPKADNSAEYLVTKATSSGCDPSKFSADCFSSRKSLLVSSGFFSA